MLCVYKFGFPIPSQSWMAYYPDPDAFQGLVAQPPSQTFWGLRRVRQSSAFRLRRYCSAGTATWFERRSNDQLSEAEWYKHKIPGDSWRLIDLNQPKMRWNMGKQWGYIDLRMCPERCHWQRHYWGVPSIWTKQVSHTQALGLAQRSERCSMNGGPGKSQPFESR